MENNPQPDNRIKELEARLMTFHSLMKRAATQKAAAPFVKEIRQTLETLKAHGWEQRRLDLYTADLQRILESKPE